MTDVHVSVETLDEVSARHSRFEPVDLRSHLPGLDTPAKRNVAHFEIGRARRVPILQEHPTPGHFWYPPETAAAYHLRHSTPKMERLARFVAMVAGAVPIDGIHDVGANAGVFAAFCTSLTPVPITCYEPIPQLIPYIEANAPQAAVRCLAIGDRSEAAVDFHVNTQSLQTSALDRSAILEETATITRISVAMERLDVLVAGRSIVKVDVQGAELAVLAGMEGCMDGCQALLMESTYLSLDTVTDLVPFVRAAGFARMYVVNDVSFGADVLFTRAPVAGCESEAARAFDL